ncbi:AfsR/SARP family transcriptional regulator [Nonomuraea sp. NPDC052116]|uniref:AfsR/SARP family transcriptional regulator n=1 Tax=Nonomuraea sp. NPDC052116 TaxID=3155665 RepID=UPI00344896D4
MLTLPSSNDPKKQHPAFPRKIEFQLLGNLDVRLDNGDYLPILRPKHRQLLALLLLQANVVVPVDALIDRLWDGTPPASAFGNLKTYIWELRRSMSPDVPADSPIDTVSNGYRIRVEPDGLDITRFKRLAKEGHRALHQKEHETAWDHFERALRTWRGRALQDTRAIRTLRNAAAHLEEQRISVVAELVELLIARGEHAEAIEQLRSVMDLVEVEEPRERLWGQLMLALYLDGRQAEALSTYQRLRRLLINNVGVEPTNAIQELHQRILSADFSLDVTC